MDLTIDDAIVGKFYCNVQISKHSLPDISHEFKIKKGEHPINLDGHEFFIKTYKRFFDDGNFIYFEGAVLSFKK